MKYIVALGAAWLVICSAFGVALWALTVLFSKV